MCIRKPEPEPETRFWIFQTRKPGFGRTAPGLETLLSTYWQVYTSHVVMLTCRHSGFGC